MNNQQPPLPQTMPMQYAHPQQLSYSSHQPHKIVASRGWHLGKILFGSIALIMAIVLIGLSGGYVGAYPDAVTPWICLIVGCTIGGASLLWQTSEFITLCVRRDRGIHPGAHVAIHLIIWLGCAGSIGLLAIFLADDIVCTSLSCRRRNFLPTVSLDFVAFIALQRAILSCVGLLLGVHFILFVRYCIECDRRNKGRPPVLMIAGSGPNANMYYVPQQHMPHTQMAHQSYMPPPQQYMPPPPTTTQSPPPGSHASTYGGFYNPPDQHSYPDPAKVSELHSTSPVPPSGVSTVSTEPPVTHAHNQSHGHNVPHPDHNYK